MATSHCVDCGAFFCDRCQKSHKKLKATAHHHFISLDDYFKVDPNPSSSARIGSKNRISHCSEHPQQVIDSFCKTCMISICPSCAVKSHSGHHFSPIEEVIPGFIKSIKDSFIGVKIFSFFSFFLPPPSS